MAINKTDILSRIKTNLIATKIFRNIGYFPLNTKYIASTALPLVLLAIGNSSLLFLNAHRRKITTDIIAILYCEGKTTRLLNILSLLDTIRTAFYSNIIYDDQTITTNNIRIEVGNIQLQLDIALAGDAATFSIRTMTFNISYYQCS